MYIKKKEKRQTMTNIGVKYELHQVLSVGLLRPAFPLSRCCRFLRFSYILVEIASFVFRTSGSENETLHFSSFH